MKAALVIAVLVLLVAVLVVLLYPGTEENNDSVHNHVPLEEFDTASIPEGEENRNIGETITYNPKPCMKNRNNNAYNKFVSKHVLKTVFDTSSHSEWKKYLEKNKLCDRPRQSFVDKGAENLYMKICNGFGKRQDMNLCTSTSPVRLHDLNVSTSDCSITYLYSGDKYVTVACDKVNNRCRPVHFQSSQNSGPDSTALTCKP
ncbi:uncharacterized protein LOC111611237 [Xiphophorus maculatus]|uniref:uncharacterized protein LOC111611237 n=1 Tax=Xiphophorus maculatus TaxID=8083 RepID=UPI000C6CBC8A|nr:uncharacterized protein LOC111611237 [Xiphophorus maculatus]XP_023202890.1 uncharacterized protein LOC111611237 [Xiphophorus maculatus]